MLSKAKSRLITSGKKITLLFILNFSSSIFNFCFSQAPPIQWQNTIGGDSSDSFPRIYQTTDGGFILGGTSNSGIFGDKTESNIGVGDYWIVKISATGAIQWQNTIGGSSNDGLHSVQQTTDGGYILGGASNSNISGDKTEHCIGGTLEDYWIVKTDSAGNIQWQNTIGGTFSDILECILQTADGGYIVGGTSISNISGDKTENSIGFTDYWIVKTDSAGNIQWQNTIGGDKDDFLYSVSQTVDGGYILGGASMSNVSGDKTENSNGWYDYWLVKVDAFGVIQWQNTIGGIYDDGIHSIQQTFDGGYIIGGSSDSNISGDKSENSNGNYDYWILKIDATGNIQWQNTIGGSSVDYLYSLGQTTDGGYILGGYSSSNISGDKTEDCLGAPYYDYWVVKIDSGGSIQWQNTIGGNNLDVLSSIQQTADGGYILGGHSSSNISSDKTENCIGIGDYWIVKLSPEVGLEELDANETLLFFPNPATDELVVWSSEFGDREVEIYNALGEKVFESQISNLKSQFSIDVSRLSPGIYFVRVKTNGGISTGRFVKE